MKMVDRSTQKPVAKSITYSNLSIHISSPKNGSFIIHSLTKVISDLGKTTKMAEVIIEVTVRFLLDKVISLASDKIGLVFGFSKDLQALRHHARDIQAVLDDAETKQSESEVVNNWLQKVEGAAVEAGYLLDELLYESLFRQVKSRDQAKVYSFLSSSKHEMHDISFRYRMGSKVRDINERLEAFKSEAVKMELLMVEAMQTRAFAQVARSRQTDSLPMQFVVGRDAEVSNVVKTLLASSSNRNVSIFSIVGMGGLGKTTLAKSVYNHPQIVDHFSEKGWICVSDRFEVVDIFRGILESLKQGKIDTCGRDVVAQQLHKKVDGRRFLFVLDDVWDVDRELWDDFFTSLVALNPASGSCCLLTTRLHKNANLVSTLDALMLGKLLDDDCWLILTQRATRGGDIPVELKVHRNQILRKCQGIPLVAKAIGGLLSLQRKQNWPSIIKNMILKISDDDVGGEIRPILKLSFDNLPSPSIKKCFVYCSIYAKDMEMSGEKLIQFWMAEGFIHDDTQTGILMEEIGDSYLKILLQSSLLEEVVYKPHHYQMHDLVHDLAESIKNREIFYGENKYLNIRHLTDDKVESGSWNARSPLVRIVKGCISNETLLTFKYLHILNLSGEGLESLVPSISKLKHLRHLTISCLEAETTLSETLFCKLYNLQTLRLEGCHHLKSLPPGLINLISLRHLHFNTEDNKFQMPPNMGMLTCLQTLEFFNIGKEKGCGIEELGSMSNLRGSLEIRNLECVQGKKEARLAKLFEKKNLKNLELSWGFSVLDHELVLEGLEPHSNLQKLNINNFMGGWFPSWMENLSSLVKLVFFNCKNCTILPTLGHLPSLKELHLCGLDSVECIEDSFYKNEHFQDGNVFHALEYLKLSRMMHLADWKEFKAINHGVAFPNMKHMYIEDCCELSNAPSHFPSLSIFTINGNIQVSVVRGIVDKSASLLKSLTLLGMRGFTSLSDVIQRDLAYLEYIHIWNCVDLVNIPSSTLECCISLQVLTVQACPNLFCFPLDFHQTPSLTVIRLDECPKLFSACATIPRGFNHLTSLWEASIGPFSDDAIGLFDWPGLQACSSLRSLTLFGYPYSLPPPQLQRCTSLEHLTLVGFKSIEGLPDWLGDITSVKSQNHSSVTLL